MKLPPLGTLKLGLNDLLLHKLRSLLTSLGIIFGVAAVIRRLSISEDASAEQRTSVMSYSVVVDLAVP